MYFNMKTTKINIKVIYLKKNIKYCINSVNSNKKIISETARCFQKKNSILVRKPIQVLIQAYCSQTVRLWTSEENSPNLNFLIHKIKIIIKFCVAKFLLKDN